MLRGEVRFADLDPARGSEADKTRLVVVVSNDRLGPVVGRLEAALLDRLAEALRLHLNL